MWPWRNGTTLASSLLTSPGSWAPLQTGNGSSEKGRDDAHASQLCVSASSPSYSPICNANWQEAATFLLELLGRGSAESQPLGHRCAKPPTVSHPGWKGQQQQRHMWLFKGIVAPGPETHDMRADQGARYWPHVLRAAAGSKKMEKGQTLTPAQGHTSASVQRSVWGVSWPLCVFGSLWHFLTGLLILSLKESPLESFCRDTELFFHCVLGGTKQTKACSQT